MSLREEVAQWTAEARRTLELAQQISTLAHASLETANDILTSQLPAKIKAITGNYEAAEKQHDLVLELVKHVQETVLSMTNGHQHKVATILQPALRELDTVLATLHGVEVPLFLVNREKKENPSEFRLDDFIAVEEIDDLTANVQIYIQNGEKMATLLRKRLRGILKEKVLLLAQYSQLTRAFNSHIIPLQVELKNTTIEPAEFVGNTLSENDALGLELTSLLGMLTNHYDQCMLAVSLARKNMDNDIGVHNDNDSDINSHNDIDIEVLRNDTLELPEVILEVRAIHDILSHNSKRASSYVAQKLAAVAQVALVCALFQKSCTDFKTRDVTQLLLLVAHGSSVYSNSSLGETLGRTPITSPVEAYAGLLTGLCDHYRQFLAVYRAQYLSELHYEQFVYPRRFLKVLDECLNGTLLAFEDEERARRHEWLRKYGEYIPGDFCLPGEAGQPRVVQVVSEGLDHLDSPSADLDEGRLVQLLKETRLLRGK